MQLDTITKALTAFVIAAYGAWQTASAGGEVLTSAQWAAVAGAGLVAFVVVWAVPNTPAKSPTAAGDPTPPATPPAVEKGSADAA